MVDPSAGDAPTSSDAEIANRSPGPLSSFLRVVHTSFVLTIVAFVVAPNIPAKVLPIAGDMAALAKQVSFKQGWQMYAPNPQRAQMYMNLTAVYDDGSERRLEETEQENRAWDTHFMWDKTRIDIWRQYANFNPKHRNNNRVWYLKGVCVRESRKGPIPKRIVMHQVRRRFTPPGEVAEGAPELGKPRRTFITVQYCQHPVVKDIIEADTQRSAEAAEPAESG